MKRFLKGVSLLLVAALIVGTVAITVMNNAKVSADETYKVLEKNDAMKIKTAPWTFADGLKNTKNKPRADVTVDQGTKYKITNGYMNYDGTYYDLWFEYIHDYPALGDIDLTKVSAPVRADATENGIRYNILRIWQKSDVAGRRFHYKIWLTENGSDVPLSPTESTPFIIGPCSMGNDLRNSSPYKFSVEQLEIYSDDNTLYTNMELQMDNETDGRTYLRYNTKGNYDEQRLEPDNSGFQSWTVPLKSEGTDWDKVGYYILGTGYDNEHKANGGYSGSTASAGALEIRVGYKAYTITYKLAGDSNSATMEADPSISANTNLNTTGVKDDVPVNGVPNKPTFTPNTDTDILSYIKIKSITGGEPGATLKFKPGYKGGREIKVGDELTPDDINNIVMNRHVEVEVKYVARDTKYTLDYDLAADSTYAPLFPDENNYPQETNLTPRQPSATHTEYKKGQTYTGTDGKKYVFRGWYYNPLNLDTPGTNPDAVGMAEFIPGTTTIGGNTRVIGKWEPYVPAPSYSYTPSSVTLSFDTNGNGGYDKPGSQSGASGFTGKVPADIKVGDIIDGYKFTGWFKDKDGKEPFDFKTGITNSTTAYAGWEKVDENTPTPDTTPEPDAPVVKVEFETEIGVPPATQVEVPGNTALDPGAPMDVSTLKPGTVINGKRFEGWYLDKGYTVKYDFNTPLTEDIILYAKWVDLGTMRSPKTGEQTFPVVASLACLALLGGLLIIKSTKRRREDI